MDRTIGVVCLTAEQAHACRLQGNTNSLMMVGIHNLIESGIRTLRRTLGNHPLTKQVSPAEKILNPRRNLIQEING